MFKSVSNWNRFGLQAVILLWVTLVSIMPAPSVFGQTPPADSKKFRREIRMMESVLNHVMVDSRNVLVGSRDAVNGAYLPGYGALFTVEAQLLLRDRHIWNWANWSDDDDHHYWRRDRDDDDEKDEDYELWKTRNRRNEERLYTDTKEELTEALLDYGDALTELGPSDWVAVCMYFDESVHIADKRITRLTIKGRAQDLRDYASKKLSQDAATAKLVVEEY